MFLPVATVQALMKGKVVMIPIQDFIMSHSHQVAQIKFSQIKLGKSENQQKTLEKRFWTNLINNNFSRNFHKFFCIYFCWFFL